MGKRFSKVSKIRLSAVLIILALSYSLLCGLDPDKEVDSYLVDQWEMPDDIPSNMIRAIAQTPDGYLWFATNKCLVRFDGIKFAVTTFVKKEEIQSQQTIIPDTLFKDKAGNLWIGSSAGLTLYDYRRGGFKTFTASQGITQDRIRHINQDMKGNLWITFYSSYVNRFSNEKFTSFDTSHGLESNKINAIVEDRNGNLLFATKEKGIFRSRDGKFYKYKVPGLENLSIITMVEDKKGDLWIGTDKGLFQLNDKIRKSYTTRDGLSDNYITAILEDSDRNLWIGTVRGLNRLKKKQDSSVVFESLLKPFIIFSLFEDEEQSLWVGTYDSGIKRLKDGKFTSYIPLEAFPEEILFSLFQDQKGDTWVGTASGKLVHFQGSSHVKPIQHLGLSGTGIIAIFKDRVGDLWLGTNGRGVFQIKNGTLTRFTTHEGLTDNQVSSIFQDRQGNLWFSTFDGVSVRRSADGIFKSFTSKDGLSGKRVHNVYEDKTHNILIATNKGITLLKNNHPLAAKRLNKSFAGSRGGFTKEPLAAGGKQNIEYYLKDISVTCIHKDLSAPEAESPLFWIATHGAGLKRLRLKDGKIISYTKADGLTTDFIYQFFEDQQEHFWLMSNSGILRIKKAELNLFARGELNKINCISYGRTDGMKSSEFHNEFSRNSAFKTKSGELWFLTRKGIAIVNPARVRVNKIPPPVVIEEVFFDQQSIPLHQDKHVFKGITDFSFHFTALTFISPEKVKFKYQLKGFDNGWLWLSLPPGSKRVVHYQNLEPGTYTFRVIACNSDGIWNQTGNSITFTLKPFFYQTFIFKVIVFLLVGFLMASAVYFYKKRSTKEKTKEERKEEEEKEKEEKQKEKYKDSELDPRLVEECTKKLTYLMEVEKVYCDPEISLHSLAEKLSITHHVLSQFLNEKMGRNFFDYINYLRIKEAKRIFGSPEEAEKKITAVAFEVGFNTMTPFYKAFKKYTGMIPKEYKEKIKKKKM